LNLGVLCSRVRLEEKLIFQALRERGVGFEKIDVRQIIFDLGAATMGNCNLRDCDAVLIRCVSHSRALYAARLLQMQGVKTVSSYGVIATCGDKVLTTLALLEHNVPTPRTVITLSEMSALASIEEIGYPAVLKPPVGSWGRLMAKINDRQAAEALIEHKQALDRSHTFYVQSYIDKPGRDIRTLVVGGETVYAVYRNSHHWITNTARGGDTSSLPITPGDEVDRLSRAAAEAVGGGSIVAVDILEAPDGSLLVNEVNHTPEFHGALRVVEADIVGKMVDYVLEIAREET
jgi:[lysine-biosynthesis-protein LysW]--L-2-aminoadipate ligase